MSRFVLEIGTEEIPPRFFPPALAQLLAEGQETLERARLSFREVKVYATPRRLALVAEGVAERQAAHTREERGPAARVAFDLEGKPTKAAQGFARRHGLSPDQLVVKETDQGEYVFAVVQEPELTAREALAGRLPGLIANISFPKAMRWGTGKFRFGRPIRWLLALVDEEVVEFEIEGLPSGRKTRGHPVLADGMYEVASASEYEACLREHSVIVDPGERRSLITQQLAAAAQAEQARLVDGGLLEETTYLLEYPTAAVGRFSPDFLDLPRAVLVEEMRRVQSYFPLENDEGNLLPAFIAVRDGGDEHLGIVVKGWEGVLRAKLIDASFFYEQDLKTKLADRVEDLAGVVFQEKLGTVREKVERLLSTVREAAAQASLSAEEAAALERAALLCKADLTTEMVLELSTLQGAMGREYALASGEPAAVAEAVGEHYRPRFAGDGIPETKLGRLLAVADKLDTLAALSAVGVVATGSADPFGLRREAAGVVNILISAGEEADPGKRLSLSLERLLDTVFEALIKQVGVKKQKTEVKESVTDFIRDRLAVYLREGDLPIRYDLVNAALAVGIDDISQAAKRARALHIASAWDDEAEPPAPFLETVVACTRPINIAKGFEGGEVDPDLFQEAAEKDLWQAFEEVAGRADEISLLELLQLIAGKLRAPIDRYFDDVLVMDEDEKLRRNRLAMCRQLSQLFRRIADFSLIVQA